MNRRELVVAGLSIPFVSSAKAQAVAADPFAQVSGLGELWVIANALEAMIFLIVGLKQPEAVAQTRQEFVPYEVQLTSEGAVQIFNNALNSQKGMEHAKQVGESIEKATRQISDLLSSTSCSVGVQTNIENSFRRSSILLSAADVKNDFWWCHCFGLRLIC